MAKKYARLNWNSTTTYVSAENLNVMDKGIDDCDNSIELLNEGLKTVNNNLTAKTVEIITGVSCKYNAYQVQLYLDGALSDSSGLICTLPLTCRPLRNVKIPVTVYHDITNNIYNVSAFVLVQIDGKCVLYTAGISKIQAEYINGTHTYMI